MLDSRPRRATRTRLLTAAEARLGGVLVVSVASVIALSTQIHPPPWLHDVALFAHLAALVVGFGSVLSVDWLGLLWLVRRVSMATVLTHAHRMSPLIWVGTLGLCLTGALLAPDLHSPLTLVKMVCVLGVVVVGVLTLATKRVMMRRLPHLSRSVLLRGMVLAAASQSLWWTACLIGFLTLLRRHG